MIEYKGDGRGRILRLATDISNELLDHARYGISAIDLGKKLGIDRRTVIRYLNSLEGAGWAEPSCEPKSGRKWLPGPVLTDFSKGARS